MAVKVLADSSFIVSVFVNDHIYKKYADKLLGSKSKIFIVTIFSIEEALFVLRRKYLLNFDDLNKIILVLMNSKPFSFIEVIDQRKIARDLVAVSSRFGLKGRDTIHYLIMKRYGIKSMVTFDEDFIKRQNELGIKVLTLDKV